MTAMRAAFEKAGANTADAELQAKLIEAAKHHQGNLTKAADKLVLLMRKREDLLKAALLRLLVQLDPISYRTGSEPTPVKVKAHHRHQYRKHRTWEDREGAKRANERFNIVQVSVFDYRIDSRPIGEYRWGELTALLNTKASEAAGVLRFYAGETMDAILARRLMEHVQVSDHNRFVRDVVSEATMKDIIELARAEASATVETGKNLYTNLITNSPSAEEQPHESAGANAN